MKTKPDLEDALLYVRLPKNSYLNVVSGNCSEVCVEILEVCMDVVGIPVQRVGLFTQSVPGYVSRWIPEVVVLVPQDPPGPGRGGDDTHPDGKDNVAHLGSRVPILLRRLNRH